MADDETGFSVVDKRQASEVKTDNLVDNAGAETLDIPQEDPLKDLPNLAMRDRLLMSIDILNQGAWIAMGFISNPATGAIEKDLSKAKIAIDCVAFLASKVEDELDVNTQRELKALVNNLQVNFVQQMS